MQGLAVRRLVIGIGEGVGQGIAVSATLDSRYTTLASRLPDVMSSVYIYVHFTASTNGCSYHLSLSLPRTSLLLRCKFQYLISEQNFFFLKKNTVFFLKFLLFLFLKFN